ncbi:MAG: tetratricopeptide repeat protein [Bacteroidota bacterium]|nr:tetratricopeptide repeat protein [Bacteroidota bacterium]
MKKFLILPIIALMTSFVPMYAEQNNSATGNSESAAKAEELNKRASWIIILNSTNTDSLNLAVKLCTEAIELDGELADAFFNRGDAYYFLGDFTTAIKDFDIAVEKRGDAYDHQFRGETRVKLGDNDGALADFKKAADKGFSSTASGAHLAMNDANDLGILFYDAEQYDKAVEAFTISVNAQENKNNTFNRANAEYLAGDKAAALVDWKRSGKLGNKSGKESYKKFRKG